jgi:polyribonucleotide nucleotidyltransferase
MDLVVARYRSRCADGRVEIQLSEEIMLGAIVYGHEQATSPSMPSTNWCVTQAVWAWQSASQDEMLIAKVGEVAGVKLQAATRSVPSGAYPGLPRGDVGSHGR